MFEDIIRIPRTTAMFIYGLAQILREELNLPICQHEHWTLQHVAQWEDCGQPGECSDHGISEKHHRQIHKASADGDLHHNRALEVSWCYPYITDVYVGSGLVSITCRVGENKVKLRTRITRLHSDALGTIYDAEVWALKPDGEIVCGRFNLYNDGKVSRSDEGCSPHPPSRLAFWRSPSLDDTPVST